MVISKKKVQFNLISNFPILLPKPRCSLKKRSHLESISIFPTFRPDFIITSNKHLQQIETVCIIFEGGPRQLSHSPHPISTTNVPSKSLFGARGTKGRVSSGECSNVRSWKQNSQKSMYEKKRVLISSFTFKSRCSLKKKVFTLFSSLTLTISGRK